MARSLRLLYRDGNFSASTHARCIDDKAISTYDVLAGDHKFATGKKCQSWPPKAKHIRSTEYFTNDCLFSVAPPSQSLEELEREDHPLWLNPEFGIDPAP